MFTFQTKSFELILMLIFIAQSCDTRSLKMYGISMMSIVSLRLHNAHFSFSRTMLVVSIFFRNILSIGVTRLSQFLQMSETVLSEQWKSRSCRRNDVP